MPSFSQKRRNLHSAEDMFALVADVERYPEFLPFCRNLRIVRRTPGEEGVETLVADMEVGYKAIHERFTTRVTLDRPRLRILVEYIDGPFRYLENRWMFRAAGAGSEVEFFIDYEFRSRMLAFIAGAVFDQIFRTFVSAFERRADQLFGAKAPVAASG